MKMQPVGRRKLDPKPEPLVKQDEYPVTSEPITPPEWVTVVCGTVFDKSYARDGLGVLMHDMINNGFTSTVTCSKSELSVAVSGLVSGTPHTEEWVCDLPLASAMNETIIKTICDATTSFMHRFNIPQKSTQFNGFVDTSPDSFANINDVLAQQQRSINDDIKASFAAMENQGWGS